MEEVGSIADLQNLTDALGEHVFPLVTRCLSCEVQGKCTHRDDECNKRHIAELHDLNDKLYTCTAVIAAKIKAESIKDILFHAIRLRKEIKDIIIFLHAQGSFVDRNDQEQKALLFWEHFGCLFDTMLKHRNALEEACDRVASEVIANKQSRSKTQNNTSSSNPKRKPGPKADYRNQKRAKEAFEFREKNLRHKGTCTWEEVAAKFHYNTSSAARKAVDRYLDAH